MYFERFYDPILAHASYLIGDETSGVAAVIDPARDANFYIEKAQASDLHIKYVILTRISSAFVTGHREFRDLINAIIICSTHAQIEFLQAKKVDDGDEITLGSDIKLKFLMTPGATPDGLSCIIYEKKVAWGVFTGDALPVDAVPRVDVAVGCKNIEEQTSELYNTLQRKLLTLPTSTRIYPLRGFTTTAARGAPAPVSATIGQQCAANPILKISRQSFTAISLRVSRASTPPIYGNYVFQHNCAERPTLHKNLEDVRPLNMNQVLNAMEKGAIIIDGKSSLDFLLAHIRNSISVPLDACYAPWVGTLIKPNTPIILFSPEGRALESAIALSKMGIDSVWGYVNNTIGNIRYEKKEILTHIPVLSSIEIQKECNTTILDVRNSAEYESGHLPDSTLAPLDTFKNIEALKLNQEQQQILVSGRGDRASTAASILARHNFKHICVLMGGIQSWKESGYTLLEKFSEK